jgi:hypothetical protein
LTNFGKKIVVASSQAIQKPFFYFYALIFFTLTLATMFVSASFFAKGLKTEGERLKVKFWSSGMVKIGKGQHNYHRCPHCHRIQNFVVMKTTV